MLVRREDIAQEARSWVGTRYRHQGRSKNGVDCAGLVAMVGRNLGLVDETADVFDYGRRTHGPEFINHLKKHLIQSRVVDLTVGSVLSFRVPRFSCHIGIVTEKNGALYIVHGSLLHRKVWEEPYANEWPGLVTHCFEFPGVENG